METVECLQCGEEYEVLPYRADTTKYCSKTCHNKARQNRTTHTCKTCNEQYTVRPSEIDGETNFCSVDCRAKYYSGEKHHFWDGGDYVSEYGAQWPLYREYILSRDEVCQLCECIVTSGSNEKNNACVHHIKPVSSFSSYDDAHTVDNLVLLCRSCHGKVEQSKKWTEEMQKEKLL